MPQEFLSQQLAGVTRAMAIEEIEPYLEDMLRIFANAVGQDLKVYGKTSGQVQLGGRAQPGAHRAVPGLVHGRPGLWRPGLRFGGSGRGGQRTGPASATTAPTTITSPS